MISGEQNGAGGFGTEEVQESTCGEEICLLMGDFVYRGLGKCGRSRGVGTVRRVGVVRYERVGGCEGGVPVGTGGSELHVLNAGPRRDGDD